MIQIHAPEAHAITGGSPEVVVGDIDTGLDFTHPDLAPNYDAANSTDCSSGTPAPLLPGNDVAGHGTHTAGTIAAASNGTGIVGVAPNVRIAGIKSSTDEGFFFPEMVICSYMWVATHDIDVTNNSYFADPWLFNCRNDAEQRAIWTAERRAIRFAQSQGTVVVASEGNESTDLSHPEVDVISPDFPPGNEVDREITNACAVVPVEVPGVVGVTATGNLQLKSFYSSYGISTADVAAPGGDSLLQVTAAAPNGRVLSTYPTATPCLRTVLDPQTGAKYCYLQGTSMAGPHVAGVAALIMSQTGRTGGALASAVQQATNPLPCPADDVYEDFPQNSGEPQHCSGGTAHNSFYGSGEIDALLAVS
jgi:subtilisin family serine protease